MPSTIADTITRQLAEQILSGKLTPGERIEEKRVTELFGVSRTPVRDALRQLSATGLVAIQPHRGVTVVDLAPEQLSDMFEAQAEIEALCARLSARRMNGIERKKLQKIAQSSEPALATTDHELYSNANEEFHMMIYAGSHNETLEQIAINLWNRVAPFRRSVVFKRGTRMQNSFDEHDIIIEAIISGDEKRAATVMHDHISSSSVNAIEYLSEKHP